MKEKKRNKQRNKQTNKQTNKQVDIRNTQVNKVMKQKKMHAKESKKSIVPKKVSFPLTSSYLENNLFTSAERESINQSQQKCKNIAIYKQTCANEIKEYRYPIVFI